MKHFCKGFILSLFFVLPITLSYGQSSTMIEIEKLPFNSRQFSEIAAVIVPNGIIFCSDRRISGVVNNKTFDGDRVYSIFYAEREDSTGWSNARIYSRDLQSLFTQGPFCFSPDRRQLYYTSDIEKGSNAFSSDFDNRSGIFIAERTAGGWSSPRAFEYNDPLWNVGHPYISVDGRYLFFSSDIPGGYGGADLYMCRWENDKWSDPENLGESINSPFSELYPYFGPDGELYFASDRDGGYGGLDLYRARLNNETWSDPVLLPQPINSIADDFSLFKERYAETGFFASNRDRTDDIYMYTSLLIRESECNELVYDNYCYEFSEVNSMKFDSLPFKYEWDFGDGTTLKSDEPRAEHCFEDPGTYLVNLNAIDTVLGDIQHNEANYLLEIEQTEQAFITAPDTCYLGESISLDASMTYLPGWDIKEYYWNFDDGTGGKGLNIDKTYSVEGVFNVQLIVSTYPNDEGNINKTCVSRNIIVRER